MLAGVLLLTVFLLGIVMGGIVLTHENVLSHGSGDYAGKIIDNNGHALKGVIVTIEKESKEEEIDGMCEICGIREAKHVCIKCGRKVCSADFWTMLGICKLCLPEAEMKKWRKEHPF